MVGVEISVKWMCFVIKMTGFVYGLNVIYKNKGVKNDSRFLSKQLEV